MDIWLHIFNIALHILCGTLAIGIGVFLLASAKGTLGHKRWGLRFTYLGLVVCATATIGNIFFRFLPLFAILTLLVLYLLISGWRNILNKERGPQSFDALLTGCGYLGAFVLTKIIATAHLTIAPVILYSTLGAVALILIYDSLRWTFPKTWHETLWRYEHVYKMVSGLFAMISAFFGNSLRAGQPWSQLHPR